MPSSSRHSTTTAAAAPVVRLLLLLLLAAERTNSIRHHHRSQPKSITITSEALPLPIGLASSCAPAFLGPRLFSRVAPSDRCSATTPVREGATAASRVCVSRPPAWRRTASLSMDVDGPDRAQGSASGATESRVASAEREAPWPGDVPATVDLPKIEVPLDLPQPGEWLHVPTPARKSRAPLTTKPDPFSVPDNQYKDSWLDSVWINLFATRMASALEAEEGFREGQLRGGAGSSLSEGGESHPPPENNVIKKTGKAFGASGEGNEILPLSSPFARFVESMPIKKPKIQNRAEEKQEGGFNEGGGKTPALQGGIGGGYTYDDYVALATRLQAGPPERQRQVVAGVLRSIFPSWFPMFYRMLFPPSKFSAEVNAFMCPPLFAWLVGKSELQDGVVDLKGVGGEGARQETWRNTVKVERCRYLEASKCKGTCMNLCKLPTEAFFRDDLGMPMRMTPNFEDLSCEFAFGQAATSVEEDPLMKEPCWTECLNSGKQPKAQQRACHTMPESPLKE